MPIHRIQIYFIFIFLLFLIFRCSKEKQPDNQAPVVTITTPADSQTVYDEFTVTASASDNVGILKVEFFIDNTVVPVSEDLTSPYEYIWNTTGELDSSYHYIYANAYDMSNNITTSKTVVCVVNNEGRAPVPVALHVPEEIDKHSIYLSWEKSIDKDFREYRLYRNIVDVWDSTAALVSIIQNRSTLNYRDIGVNADSSKVTPYGLDENTRYYYQLAVVDSFDLQGRSVSTSGVTILPTPVTLKDSYKATKYSVTISWYSTNEDVRYYRVHRSRQPTVGSTMSDSVGIAAPENVAYTDTGLVAVTGYYYKMFLIDSAGYSVGSNTIRIETAGIDTLQLFTPLEDDISKCAIRLRWTRNHEEDNTTYNLFRSDQSGVTSLDDSVTVIENKDDTVYVDRCLEQGKTYYYILHLRDSRDNLSISNEVNATTLQIQPLQISSTNIEKYSAQLNWEKYGSDDFLEYGLYRDVYDDFDTASAESKLYFHDKQTTQHIDANLILDQTYYYKFSVRDTFGYAALSLTSIHTKSVQPVEIKSVEVVSDQSFLITFTMNREDEDFSHYEVYRAKSSEVDMTDTKVLTRYDKADTSFTDVFEQSQIAQFFYRAYVFDQRGNSCTGSNVMGDTLNADPSPVELSVDGTTHQSVTLSWTKNQNEDFQRYSLYRCVYDDFTKDSPDAVHVVDIYNEDVKRYEDQNLSGGVLYYYIIYIFDIGGKYAASNIVSGLTTP